MTTLPFTHPLFNVRVHQDDGSDWERLSCVSRDAAEIYTDSFNQRAKRSLAVVEQDTTVFHSVDDHECVFIVRFAAEEPDCVQIRDVELSEIDGDKPTSEEQSRFQGILKSELADCGDAFRRVTSYCWEQHISNF